MPLEDHILSDLLQTYPILEPQYQKVCVLLLLRALLAPVVESFILLDRWLYLKEQQTIPFLIPLFDEGLSPRNVAVVAFKKEMLEANKTVD